MNWYKTAKNWYKIAQIWMVPLDSFSDYLKALYELEYKYSMMRKLPFNIHSAPERQRNIIQGLEQELANVIDRIKDILIPTFYKWLSGHAITKPTQWAVARVGDADEIEAYGVKEKFGSLLGEYETYVVEGGPRSYRGYAVNRPSEDVIFSRMINDIKSNINKFPSFKSLLQLALEDYKTMQRDDLISEGLEEFGQRYGKKFKTEDQALAFIDKMNTRNVDVSDMLFIKDIGGLADILDRDGMAVSFLTEVYKNLVFPAWYSYWSAQGIDNTRKTIENIYKKLQGISNSNVPNAIGVISLALQATHQSGDMLDYVEDDLMDMGTAEIKDLLTQLSNSPEKEKWNQELREAGLQI